MIKEGEIGRLSTPPYKVERAIFIAAGMGSRLAPVTLHTPKPLVKVKGKRIIDSLLDAVIAVGIKEIYIVRGYLAEQFDQLLYKYPMIKFIENPNFNKANNISSAMLVRDLFKNAYVFDGDLLLYNQGLITKYQSVSNYLGIPVEKTHEWCLQSKDGKVTSVSIGGTNGHELLGISYWTPEAGVKFSQHIKEVYHSPGGKEKFWDEVILKYHLDEYDVGIRECSREDIVEIDTFSELIALDSSYKNL